MTDALVFRLQREVREMTQGIERGTPHALKVRALLLSMLDAIRLSIRADDALRLEQLIDGRTV